MSNNYVPCFKRTDFVVIPSYIELSDLNWLSPILLTDEFTDFLKFYYKVINLIMES